MSFCIKDPTTNAAARELAKLRGTTLTEAIRVAVEAQLALEKEEENEAAVDRLIAKVAAWPDSGLKADKAFYDSLNDD
jgi:antitoxin VapB